jgi:Ca2+-transporting ATPase
MNEPPRPLDQPILDKGGFIMLGIFGAYIGAAALCLYGFYLDTSYALANTVAFTTLVILSNVLVLNFRSFEKPLHKVGWFSNPWLLGAVIAMIVLQIATVYVPFMQGVLKTVPLGWNEWALVIAVALLPVVLSEFYKTVKFRGNPPAVAGEA